MPRYIDADKADVSQVSIYCDPDDVQQWLDEQPTADVAEVRHGEWKPNTVVVSRFPDEYVTMNDGWKCSLCGRTERQKEPYCNCGAKMDGGKTE